MDNTGLSDPALYSPLAFLRGAKPPAPDWFTNALAHQPERSFIPVAGARIETLTWGERGRPGLLFLHGNAAHADWWSFIAPFFLPTYRVAALSWSGMGGSDRRQRYSLDLFIEEAMTVAQATGLFDGPGKPVLVGHSFGGFITLAAASRMGQRLGAAITVDTPIFTEERRRRHRAKSNPRETRPNRVYPTLEAALERFRFAPVQPCANLFITDFIARASLKEVGTETGEAGWTWRFDPFLWRDYHGEDPAPALSGPLCPLALVLGARSTLMDEADHARMRRLLKPGSPVIEIPEAYHHVMADQPLALVTALRSLLATIASPQPHSAKFDALDEKIPTNRGLA
jgi:pimeloyl-ACP methyl ester carboxylesterase